jgi:hypothetical protein
VGGALGVVTALSLLMGALIAHEGLLAAAVLIATPVMVWLALAHPGIAVGGLWLFALNGIPLVNLQSGVGQLHPTDIAVIAMALMAVTHRLLSSGNRQQFPAPLSVACALLGAWWSITFVRSLNAGVPAIDAFFFGRDFLSVTIILPAAWVLLGTLNAWRECVVVVLVGTGIFGLAYIGGALGVVNAASFTHPELINTVGAVQRQYSSMNDLVVAVAVFSLAVLATVRAGRATPFVAALTAITVVAFLLQLTRAAYLGMAIGGVIAIAIALTRGPHVRQLLLRRLTFAAVLGAIALFAVIGLGSAGSKTNAISQRLTSSVSTLSEKSGTVGYRVALYDKMLEVLGSDWPAGLGFLHPKDRYFPSLPSGDIRNPDVGLLNAVMTMGLVGLALLFGVLGAVGRYVARTRSRRPTWLVVGLFGWLAVLVAGSPTLITLFSPTGLLSTALTLVLCSVAISKADPFASLSDAHSPTN